MLLLLVYSYFLLVSQCCLDAVDPGMNDKINQLFENYMQLDLKFRAVSNENVLMKKRLDDLELVTDQVKEWSEENIQLKHRVNNLENLELQVEKVLQENVLLRQRVSRLRDRIKESQHEKTFDTNTIAITNQKSRTDLKNKNNDDRRGRDIENSLSDHPSMKHQLHPDMKQKVQYTKKRLREERDIENLITDHPDFEIHTPNNEEKFRKTEKGFRSGRDMENLISDHPDFEIHTQNNVEKFRKTEKGFREGRYVENSMPDHPDFEQHTHNNMPNFRKTDMTEKEFQEGRFVENLIHDHPDMKQHEHYTNFKKTEKGFREGRYMENLIGDHPDFEQHTRNKVANFRQTDAEFQKERENENALSDHSEFEKYLPNKVTNYGKTKQAFRKERDIENALHDHSEFEQNIQSAAEDDVDSNVYKSVFTGDKDLTNKRLLTDTAQQPTTGLVTKAAFSVSLSTELILGQHQIVEYDHVYTNIGNGYDTRHGHFIAASKAIYLFSCSMLNTEGVESFLEIVKNGRRIAHLYSDENDYNFANQVVIIGLDKGDMVWVRNALGTGQKLGGSDYNTFSGTILFETD